mmetsp:Transcript_4483/g.10784  ORF Transcript_4483/g.10784 Transcript_4483/m.10784 type:complete len:275 (+) Transcript_4483:1138-1962(+)
MPVSSGSFPSKAVDAAHVVAPKLAPIQLVLLTHQHVLVYGVELGPTPVKGAHQRGLANFLLGGAALRQAGVEAQAHGAPDPLLWNRGSSARHGQTTKLPDSLMAGQLCQLRSADPRGQLPIFDVSRLLVHVQPVEQHLCRRHPLEHDTQRLLGHLGVAGHAQVQQRVHGLQRRRASVEALQAEPFAGRVGDPIHHALSKRCSPTLALPPSLRCLLANLDVQQSELGTARSQVSHDQQLRLLLARWRFLGGAEHAGVLQGVAQQLAQPRGARLPP